MFGFRSLSSSIGLPIIRGGGDIFIYTYHDCRKGHYKQHTVLCRDHRHVGIDIDFTLMRKIVF